MYRMDDDDEEEEEEQQQQQQQQQSAPLVNRFFPLDDDEDEDEDEALGSSSAAPAAAGSSSYRATAGGSSRPSVSAGGSAPERNRFGSPSAYGDGLGGLDGNQLDPELHDAESLPEITKLSRAWMEERGSPDILRWKGDVVDGVIDQIDQQVTIVDSLLSDSATSQEEHLRLSLVQLDLERARWLLKAYLRTRLCKIEKFARHIASEQNVQARLSDVELGYVKKYNELQTAHLNASVLSYLPDKMHSLADTGGGLSGGPSGDMVVKPDLDEPAFVRCRHDCGQLQLPDGEMVELVKGSIHLLRYKSVQFLVEQGRVEML
ncbi:unnamed protein product [Tilletia laevis]|uniref:DNA replication complex GINS protein SLD5 n=2 Tax=Tilletia TaxID=13289 RepID=A0A177UXT8_9BASI|nr:hypothetical protein CF336_g2810 [Tilletia laevis]KAE8264183.1 hypothetical protein A4X03_0g1126 [Tilletia caries]CAD6935234.1 unnamed protein product [Tilletia controversa]KAE8205140.1 hypothetical protein CF335_g2407 [Tilletia laevis]CAD6888511.1 unnamed protein product [Tilletia caries]